ncbi:MAG: very short patch repair endonuclease [Nitrososphaerales archaeon]
MTDVLTKTQRSYNMSRIRGKNTQAELAIRRRLRSAGLKGYRIHYDLPGRPDVVFTKQRLAVFVDGCFWHMCPADFRVPATRTYFWTQKIRKNVSRDRRVDLALAERGWKVIRVWEHEIAENPDVVVTAIAEALESTETPD